MKICDFTKPELRFLEEECNFTKDERTLFLLRAEGKEQFCQRIEQMMNDGSLSHESKMALRKAMEALERE